MLIGVFSIMRGAYWDDPYPGYGAKHRRMMQARERTQTLAMGLANEIDEAKEEADEELARIAEKSQEAIGAARQALAKAQQNAAAWDVSAAAIIDVGREAIETYREANRGARRAEEPDYFEDDPFDKIALRTSKATIAALEGAISRATAGITQCKSQLAGARAQIEAEYHSFYDDEIAPFLKGIAESAATKVKDEFDSLDEAPRARSAPEGNGEVVRLKRGRAG
jgi:hypothetical protein